MFKYVANISDLAHHIAKCYCMNFKIAVDATLGNGYDTDYLSSKFNQVYSFDIQKNTIDNYKLKAIDNVVLINDSHEYLDKYILNKVDFIIYNLGFLPGGDKSITTRSSSTIKSLHSALQILASGGIVCICIYSGHSEGREEKSAIEELVCNLEKSEYGVMRHTIMNRISAPELVVIEKR
jgi:16S rRNA C1402 N4-methylase RsmH